MKHIKKTLGFYFACALFVLPAGAFAQDSQFVPGDDRIIEKDILQRIQEELGTDIAREKQDVREAQAAEAEAARRAANVDKTLRSVTLSLKDNRQVSGTVVLSQRSLVVVPDSSTQELEVPLEEIRSLEFTEWKARRLKVVNAPARASAENAPESGDSEQNSADAAEGQNPEAAAAGAGNPEGADSQAAAASQTQTASNVRVYFMPSRCRITRADDSVIEGRCRSMDWLQFSLSGSTVGAFRTYYAEERELPEGGVREVEQSLETMEAESPVDTVISIELGGFMPESNSGTAARTTDARNEK